MRLSTAFMVPSFALILAAIVVGHAQGAEDPLAVKVSLSKPYPADHEGEKAERIAIQYAVIELAQQAGLGYDFKTSLENTKPTCMKWITPKVEAIPLREALDRILKPEGLSYEVRDGRIVLVKQAGSDRAADDPLGTKVTLAKPYPLSFSGAEAERIAIQYAVIELAQQAGLGYDFKTSLENAKPTCTKWVTPQIEAVPLREALDRILKPEGLSYEVRDGKVVLKKP